MKRFYVLEDINGRRVYLGDIEVSPFLCGKEVSGNPYEPDQSGFRPSPVREFFPISFDIDPIFF